MKRKRANESGGPSKRVSYFNSPISSQVDSSSSSSSLSSSQTSSRGSPSRRRCVPVAREDLTEFPFNEFLSRPVLYRFKVVEIYLLSGRSSKLLICDVVPHSSRPASTSSADGRGPPPASASSAGPSSRVIQLGALVPEEDLLPRPVPRRSESGRVDLPQRVQVVLKDSWALTPVRSGDVVHVIDDAELFPMEASDPAAGVGGGPWYPKWFPRRLPFSRAPTRPIFRYLPRLFGVGGEDPPVPTCEVTRDRYSLVVNPDLFVGVGMVGQAANCPRISYFRSHFRVGKGVSAKAAFYGLLIHEVFEERLREVLVPVRNIRSVVEETSERAKKRDLLRDRGSFIKEASTVISRFTSKLLRMEISRDEALATLMGFFDSYVSWCCSFFGDFGTQVPYLFESTKRRSHSSDAASGLRNGKTCGVRAEEVLDIEECVASPKWGLKGFVDVSLRVTVPDIQSVVPVASKTPRAKLIIPLELKSGSCTQSERGRMNHRSQVLLYVVLLREKYAHQASICPVLSGLLYYMSDKCSVGVESTKGDFRGLIQLRNQVASSIYSSRARACVMATSEAIRHSKKTHDDEVPVTQDPAEFASQDLRDDVIVSLGRPPDVSHEGDVCGRCFDRQTCFLYHKAMEGGSAAKFGDSDYDVVTRYLMPDESSRVSHQEYVRHWIHACDLEEIEVKARREGSWKMIGPEAEVASKRTMSCMVLRGESSDLSSRGSFLTSFVRHPGVADLKEDDVDEASMSTPLTATLKQLTDDLTTLQSFRKGVTVRVSSECGHLHLCTGRIATITRGYIMVILDRPFRPSFLPPKKQLWRIDHWDYGTSGKAMRGNIFNLFLSEDSARLRKSIVELAPPTFSDAPSPMSDAFLSVCADMNPDQVSAIRKIVNAKDYALVLGMPGTGKSYTITKAIEILVLHGGMRVLVSSHTHNAVDNILLRLVENAELRPLVYRFGNPGKLHLNISPYGPKRNQSPEELREVMEKKKIFGATALCAAGEELAGFKFDVCVIDEASQMLHPIAVGPLMLVDRFVLVGDPDQLPPLVRGFVSLKHGLGKSLFASLAEAHPNAVVKLRMQYRMSREVMSLCNEVVYDNELRCGTEAVARQRLVFPLEFPSSSFSSLYVSRIIDPTRAVVILNTDLIGSESREVSTEVNLFETCVIRHLCITLCRVRGLPQTSVGVLAPYNAQVSSIRIALKDLFPKIEVNTIDRFQGLDKDCVIMSLVRSNEQREIPRIMTDSRRLNVGFTRAKSKMIVIGSLDTHTPPSFNRGEIGHYIAIFKKKKWVESIKPGEVEAFEQALRSGVCIPGPAARVRSLVDGDRDRDRMDVDLQQAPPPAAAQQQQHDIVRPLFTQPGTGPTAAPTQQWSGVLSTETDDDRMAVDVPMQGHEQLPPPLQLPRVPALGAPPHAVAADDDVMDVDNRHGFGAPPVRSVQPQAQAQSDPSDDGEDGRFTRNPWLVERANRHRNVALLRNVGSFLGLPEFRSPEQRRLLLQRERQRRLW